jgi:hypothetical protein
MKPWQTAGLMSGRRLTDACETQNINSFWQSLADQLTRNGWATTGFQINI